MFKPNSFDSESPTPTHRTFGALYNSAYDKVARNEFARVLWEAGFSVPRADKKKHREPMISFKVSSTFWIAFGFFLFIVRFQIDEPIVSFCQVETSSSPPVVMAKKPKMYLTCKISMEPRSWYKLT